MMKYLFTAALMLVVIFTKAQIVNIPDSDFKNFLLNYSPEIDVNHDGEIQVEEAAAVDRLQYPYPGNSYQNAVNFTGIRQFVNLSRLEISTIAPQLDLSDLNHLKFLDVEGYPKTLNLSGCTAIDFLTIYFCDSLTTLDISPCTGLKHLTCRNNGALQNMITGRIDSLTSIDCGWNYKLPALDFTGFKNLQDLKLSFLPQLRTLNCRGLDKLTHIYLTSIDTLSNFNLTGCYALENLEMMGIQFIPVLDLSSCINLSHFDNTGATNCEYLNIKNGSEFSNYLTFSIASNTIVCADEFEIQNILQYNPSITTITSYCTFFPGGNYNTISGKINLDRNNNGCDGTDRGMPSVAIKIQDTSGNSLIRHSTLSGDYAHYSEKGIFTLTPYFPYPYFSVNPTSISITFDTANNLTNTSNFCIQPNGLHNDLEISFLPAWPPARPGFDASYNLVYKNRGTTTLSGNVQVNFDNSKLNFISASENVTAQSTGQLSWNYNNLQPLESKTITVTFNLLPPPINNIDDTLTYLAAITPSANDETAFDNSFILPQRVRGSYDPNEKQCLEGSKIDISKIGGYLHYQIHFQNEGTDTAFNIVVADALSDKLDWNSLELISSSHPVDVRQKNGKVEFIFENIKLPQKAINEPASSGYAAFKIKPKPSVVVGDSLNNTAAIYFDFNMPILTNRATTIVTNTSTPVPVKVEYFSISSRNNINTLNWKAACSNGTAKFNIERSDDGIHFTSIGSITETAVRCQLPFNFSDNDPVAGKNYYRLKITDADGISFYSKTLVTGNNKAGLQITGIANNVVYFTSNKQQAIQMKVVAADGKVLYQQSKTVAAGNSTINLQIKNAARQICTLVLYTNDGEIITRRFIR